MGAKQKKMYRKFTAHRRTLHARKRAREASARARGVKDQAALKEAWILCNVARRDRKMDALWASFERLAHSGYKPKPGTKAGDVKLCIIETAHALKNNEVVECALDPSKPCELRAKKRRR